MTGSTPSPKTSSTTSWGAALPAKPCGVDRQGHGRTHVHKVQRSLGGASRGAGGAAQLGPSRFRRARPARRRGCLHAGHGHGRGHLAVPERGGRDGGAGSGHQAAPEADGRGGPGGCVQGRAEAVEARVRLLHVDDGVRRPSCSTIYLDKPMRNQSLMQTITRANRVFPGKNNGLIVGYVDVLGNLHKALAIYATTGPRNGSTPIEEKDGSLDALRGAVDELRGSAGRATSTWTGSPRFASSSGSRPSRTSPTRSCSPMTRPRASWRRHELWTAFQGDPSRSAGERVRRTP